jgi:hypothetical protein
MVHDRLEIPQLEYQSPFDQAPQAISARLMVLNNRYAFIGRYAVSLIGGTRNTKLT